jgi:nicotinamidase-related amidase
MKILLVVDMQNDFISGSLGTKEAQAIVPKVSEKIAKSRGELILFTKDTHGADYLETQEGKNLPVMHCEDGSEGWMIHSDLLSAWHGNKNTIIDPKLSENVLTKNTFGSKALIEYLETVEGLEEIEIIGLCTDICVISNALLIKAFEPEVKISVDSACCAGVSPESHEVALKAMKSCQVNVN